MRVRGAERNPYADLMRVVDPQADGPVIGFYADYPIASAVIDCFGQRFTYVGAAPRRPDGLYDFEALGPHEWIVEPGLVYVSDRQYHIAGSPGSRHRSAGQALHDLKEVLTGWLH